MALPTMWHGRYDWEFGGRSGGGHGSQRCAKGAHGAAKDKPELNMDKIDKRPRTGVYSTNGNRRGRRAIELLYVFCAVSGLHAFFYIDRRLLKEDEPSEWQRLLRDIAEGKLDVVITWLESPEMSAYCQQYGVRFEVVDPWTWYRAMTSKADTVKIEL